jgi:hypothetical protein
VTQVIEKETHLRSSNLLDAAPEAWDAENALRECGLLGFPESHVKILREIFPALFTIYLEEGLYAERCYCGSSVKGQLRAVELDLRYTARFLAMVARESLDATGESDHRLGRLADRLAVHVEKLADHLEKNIVPRRKSAKEGVSADAQA